MNDLRERGLVRGEAFAGGQLGNELYYQLINSRLTRERVRLVNAATRYELDALERMARTAAISAPLQSQDGKSADDFITEILKQPREEPIKKALLAAVILNQFGRATLEDLIKEHQKQQRKAPIG